MRKTMTPGESDRFVLGLLRRKGPLTTTQIIEEARKNGVKCAESTGNFLAGMKFRGQIRGTLDLKKKAWEWSLP